MPITAQTPYGTLADNLASNLAARAREAAQNEFGQYDPRLQPYVDMVRASGDGTTGVDTAIAEALMRNDAAAMDAYRLAVGDTNAYAGDPRGFIQGEYSNFDPSTYNAANPFATALPYRMGKGDAFENYLAPALIAFLTQGIIPGIGLEAAPTFSGSFDPSLPGVQVSQGATSGAGVAGWTGETPDLADWWAQDSSAITPEQAKAAGLDMPANNIYPQGSGAPRVPTPTPQGGSKNIDLAIKAATAAAGLLSQGGATGGAGTDISGTLREQEAQRQAQLAEATTGINNAFTGFDDNYYSGIAKAYKDFAMPQFSEQVAKARRALPASVASTQSSAFQRKQGELETDISRQEAQIGNDAITQANAARGNVEQARADLLNLASAGTDSASLADQAAAKALQLSAPAQFVPLADLFSKYAADASNASLLSRPTPATAPNRPLLFNAGSGSRSVRTIK